ncbi:MAG: putative sulfate exporter family transporter [Bacteroidetes bacterium]|nr:MAG: putative sulfate exporter family transporter [Bacteroidota bacterium]REK00811.1 MAG: putative sulfate exporter family transporter [Bacteroidota bacterium]REK35051.1 MAG: putative sulfate exporter family transporter [Bacteroidota bacterium]REK48181.1 MAG: putative sulfate exporter family transporter [Bacteroidota bacterium]
METSKPPAYKAAGKILFFLFILLVPVLSLSPGISLVLGLIIGIFFGNPYPKQSKPLNKYLLQGAIIGLGFGMNFTKVITAGKDGFVFTLMTIAAAIGFGYVLGRWLRVERIISYLISVGTAICGGSAIAAVSQVVKADDKEISVSIGTVFILNAVALFIFPLIGAYFGLTQEQFGIWAAIAIHDTSSVVGAASEYGNESLMIATTVKLARALWIIPLALLTSLVFKKKSSASSFPWFIVFFLLASIANTYLQISPAISTGIVSVAKTGFSLTLFLIGCGLSPEAIKQVGLRPMLQGVILWVCILTLTLVMLIRY